MEKTQQNELEKHLPEWFLLLRKLVAAHLQQNSSLPDNAGTAKECDEKNAEVKI